MMAHHRQQNSLEVIVAVQLCHRSLRSKPFRRLFCQFEAFCRFLAARKQEKGQNKFEEGDEGAWSSDLSYHCTVRWLFVPSKENSYISGPGKKRHHPQYTPIQDVQDHAFIIIIPSTVRPSWCVSVDLWRIWRRFEIGTGKWHRTT